MPSAGSCAHTYRPLHRIVTASQPPRAHCSPGCLKYPGTYKEHRRCCLASLNTGAGPTAAPCSPPHGNLPTTPHPRLTSSTLGQPSTPQSDFIQSPGQPSIASWQTISRRPNPSRDHSTLYFCSSISVYLIVTLTCMVISPTHYYVTSRNIISRAYYFIILLRFHYSRIL